MPSGNTKIYDAFESFATDADMMRLSPTATSRAPRKRKGGKSTSKEDTGRRPNTKLEKACFKCGAQGSSYHPYSGCPSSEFTTEGAAARDAWRNVRAMSKQIAKVEADMRA